MRGIGGQTGWFYLFLLEGLLTFLIGFIVSYITTTSHKLLTARSQSFLYLPQSPVSTKSFLCRHQWYTEREEVIMINVRASRVRRELFLCSQAVQRLLRDDPAKGITAIKEAATLSDVRDAWSDNSMWGLYFLGLVQPSIFLTL